MKVLIDFEEKLKNAWIKSGEIVIGDIKAPNGWRDFILEVPNDRKNGDYAINLAMMLTKTLKKNPKLIAEELIENVSFPENTIKKIEIAGPGFINMYLEKNFLGDALCEILREGSDAGKRDDYKGKKINIEFVSANPTGVLHMGNARGAAIGDTLGNIFKYLGGDVTKEYYINDTGKQIENFGLSLEARYFEVCGREYIFPEDGYHGADILETVKGIQRVLGDSLLEVDSTTRRSKLIELGLNEKLSSIKEGLKKFRIEYDIWFSEKKIYAEALDKKVIETLAKKDLLLEEDGATWLDLIKLGEEKNEVLIRGNGIPTYYTGDIAYHKNKFDRGFDIAIDIWGADHHGHVRRLKKALEAIDCDEDKLEVILMQLVRLFKDGDILRMSKRTGTYITLEELLDEVGIDAARYFFLVRNPDSHLDFDLDVAKKKTNENPVFYIQYAYARISSIFRKLEDPLEEVLKSPILKLSDPAEYHLIETLSRFSKVLLECGNKREPYRLGNYALEVATNFHQFYAALQILNIEDKEIKISRIKIIYGTKLVLNNTLSILGIEALEKM